MVPESGSQENRLVENDDCQRALPMSWCLNRGLSAPSSIFDGDEACRIQTGEDGSMSLGRDASRPSLSQAAAYAQKDLGSHERGNALPHARWAQEAVLFDVR